MEQDYLDWIGRTYRLLVENKEIPKMEMKTADGGKISVYRVIDVIRVDIKPVSYTHLNIHERRSIWNMYV